MKLKWLITLCILIATLAIIGCTTESSSICGNLEATEQQLCFTEQAVATQDPDLCLEITDALYQGSCQFQVAKVLNSAESCPEITSQYWQDNCYSYFGVQENEFSFCQEIARDEQRQDCVESVAISTMNAERCLYLPTAKTTACINKVAKASGNIEDCTFLEGAFEQDLCLLRVAKAHNLPDVCPTIGFEALREDCVDATKEE